MKNSKTLLRLCALPVLCALLVSLLPSCFLLPEKLRIELMTKKADQCFEKADSYATVITARMQMPIEGSTIDVMVKEETVYHGLKGKDYSYYNNTRMELSFGKLNTKTDRTEGFIDGKHYLQNSNENGESKLYSSLSAKEFKIYLEDDDFEDFSPEEDCTTVTHTFNDDNSLTSVYEDFTEEGMEEFEDLMEGMESLLQEGCALSDVRIETVINADCQPQSMKLSLKYEKEDLEDLLALEMSCTFSGFNSTDAKAPEDLDSFTECSDLRLIDKVNEAIDDAVSGQKGSFQYISRSSASFQGDAQNNTENGTVRFEQGDKGFTYTLEGKSGGYNVTMQYENGVRTTKVQDKQDVLQEDMTDSTDEVEKAFVKNLMMPLNMGEMLFSNIEKQKDGYLFTLVRPDLSELNETLENIGGTYSSSEASLLVKLSDDGTLASLSYTQRVTYDVSGNTFLSTSSYELEILEQNGS